MDITVRRVRTLAVIAAALLVAVAVILSSRAAQPAAAAAERAEGAGRTIIQGGTGGTGPTPVTTLVAFHAGNGSVATVTGIGAGQHQPFTATVAAGGPGATLVLEVSGLEFDEILVDGHFAIG